MSRARVSKARVLVAQGITFALVFVGHALGSSGARCAEIVRLGEANWDDAVPLGKEVDCIYGDYVLRNAHLVAVIAEPVASRNANMTVHNVGGAVIDLTDRNVQNDQLSCFYPAAAQYPLSDPRTERLSDGSVTFHCRSQTTVDKPDVEVRYLLRDDARYLEVRTKYSNPHGGPIRFDVLDSVRADRSFQMNVAPELRTFWCYDEWWDQAYGIFSPDLPLAGVGDTMTKGRPVLGYLRDNSSQVNLAPGESFELRRFLFCGPSLLHVLELAHHLNRVDLRELRLRIQDQTTTQPIPEALVKLTSGEGTVYGSGRTDAQGELRCRIPRGRFRAEVTAVGRPAETTTLADSDKIDLSLSMKSPGYVTARITDQGQTTPCKVQFRGQGVADPFFGPDSKIHGVHNLYYSHDGLFTTPIAPGQYEVLISKGPEYDLIRKVIQVTAGQATELTGELSKSVDTTGWISSDFHSHSTPSGDNTSSQRGRVLNLLAEHIEFAPCTEHNRVSTYEPHLKAFQAEQLLASCSGIELTGQPLPVNHQNAFPIEHKPRTQDGGGPQPDVNPLTQIERLALWDGGSDKVVQGNHPNVMQIIGDKDLDGNPDGGFERMFGYMDVIEVHPPQDIFAGPFPREDYKQGRTRAIFNWMQLLNLGYRIPGVVNTDAHYNFHGSGWLRNYLRSSTDNPAEISIPEMIDQTEAGHIVMTNGPFLEVTARNSAGEAVLAGDDLAATDGKVRLQIRVQCPNWFDVNRVQVFVNGRPDAALNRTRRTHAALFSDQTVRFEGTIEVNLQADAHLIVATIGEGLGLGPTLGPANAETAPVAVANPIFVDVNGNGFEPSQDQLDLPLPLAR